jgi:hypothetical protein
MSICSFAYAGPVKFAALWSEEYQGTAQTSLATFLSHRRISAEFAWSTAGERTETSPELMFARSMQCGGVSYYLYYPGCSS